MNPDKHKTQPDSLTLHLKELSVKRPSIQTLQAYRGFAALLVLLFHGNAIIGAYFGQTALTKFFAFGHAGVDFFFVLSGFIMMFVHHQDLGQPSRVTQFLNKRFVRIYPVYWIVTLLFLPIWLLVPSFGEDYHRELVPLIKSLILFPQDHFPHVAVGWSLIHEVLFYLFFAAIIWKKKLGLGLITVWMILCAVGTLAFEDLPSPFATLVSQYNILFLIGMGSYLIWKRLSPQGIVTIAAFALGNLLFVAFGIWENAVDNRIQFTLFYGLASGLILLGCRSEFVENIFRRLRPLCFLGDASYSVYLIHYFALSVACKIAAQLPLSTASHLQITYLGISAFALFAGIVFYVIVEQPLMKLLKNRGVRQGKTSA